MVTNMTSMFENCLSMTNIDISNFYIPILITSEKMFKNCKSLISLNTNNFSCEKKTIS